QFCYRHCTHKKRLSPTKLQLGNSELPDSADAGGPWVYVCQQCHEKTQTQELGRYSDFICDFLQRINKRSHCKICAIQSKEKQLQRKEARQSSEKSREGTTIHCCEKI